ncbi:TPA: hypothetical protein N0F65_004847, partial [Lagenidium giganteum]
AKWFAHSARPLDPCSRTQTCRRNTRSTPSQPPASRGIAAHRRPSMTACPLRFGILADQPRSRTSRSLVAWHSHESPTLKYQSLITCTARRHLTRPTQESKIHGNYDAGARLRNAEHARTDTRAPRARKPARRSVRIDETPAYIHASSVQDAPYHTTTATPHVRKHEQITGTAVSKPSPAAAKTQVLVATPTPPARASMVQRGLPAQRRIKTCLSRQPSPRQAFEHAMISLGYRQSSTDTCLFTKIDDTTEMMVAVYVDDFVVVTSTQSAMECAMAEIQTTLASSALASLNSSSVSASTTNVRKEPARFTRHRICRRATRKGEVKSSPSTLDSGEARPPIPQQDARLRHSSGAQLIPSDSSCSLLRRPGHVNVHGWRGYNARQLHNLCQLEETIDGVSIIKRS